MIVKVTKPKPVKFIPIKVEFTIQTESEYKAWLAAKASVDQEVYFLNTPEGDKENTNWKNTKNRAQTNDDVFFQIMKDLTKEL